MRDRHNLVDDGTPDPRGVVNEAIAYHAAEALRLADADPEGSMAVFGTPDWAKAQWHRHRADMLRALADADLDRAVTYVRERALTAITAQAKR